MSDEHPAPRTARPGRAVTEKARKASREALAAKRAEPDRFGAPELFIVKADDRRFAWELRRFGGIVLQRSPKVFASPEEAKASGTEALAALLATPGLPRFTRQVESRAARDE